MRFFEPRDHDVCLALLDSNTPEFFAPQERADYVRFLCTHRGPYFVLERDGEVVACGGVALYPDDAAGVQLDVDSAGLTWGMVRRDLHAQGLGTALLEARMIWLRTHAPQVKEVRLSTSQFTTKYYARPGFEVTRITHDGFAPGVDAIEMRYVVVPLARP
ncbi:GNAT family N-acetyltransferase [Deinococcus peraridilitoris]|uniref:GNAT family N-acetyltransferase n=1 Tax=Deinococcus peraridilitoris TaxID=432329 RepID=UPI00059BFB88|nr:GNAT family N-acetyltransferase [Deinococcus peraridilitoris]